MQNSIIIQEAKDIPGPWGVSYLGKIERCVEPRCPSEFLIRVFGTHELANPQASIRDSLFRSDIDFVTSVANIPRFKVGSIWNNGKKLKTLEAPQKTFSIESGEHTTVSYNGHGGIEERDFVFNFREWPELSDESKDIRFCLLNGRTSNSTQIRIIIPCVEVVRFFFGSSSNLLNALFCSSPNDERHQLYTPEHSKWLVDKKLYFVELGMKMLVSDANLIARIATDDRLRKSVETIALSLHRTHADTGPRRFICPFPISEKCQLTVSGYECNSRAGVRQFFVQLIHDCKKVQKIPFEIIYAPKRDNSKAQKEDEVESASDSPPVSAPPELTEIVNLVSGNPSTTGTAPSTLIDSDFDNRWLRDPDYKTTRSVKKSQKTESRQGQKPSEPAEDFSTCQDKDADGAWVPLIQAGAGMLTQEDLIADDETGILFSKILILLRKSGFTVTPERIGLSSHETGYHSYFSSPDESKWFVMPNLTPIRQRRLYIVRISGLHNGYPFFGHLIEIEIRGKDGFYLVLLYHERPQIISDNDLILIIKRLGENRGVWSQVKLINGIIKSPFEHPPIKRSKLGKEAAEYEYAKIQANKISKKIISFL